MNSRAAGWSQQTATIMSRLHRGRRALQALLLEDAKAAKAAGIMGANSVGTAPLSEGA